MAPCECFGESESESPYGSWDGAVTRRISRSAPPGSALQWAAIAVGTKVECWAVMRGGTSSAMYMLYVAGPEPTKLVLRCHIRLELKDDAPATVTREVAALRTVAALDVSTPQLVAQDATGADEGVPCVLMTWLPGRVVWDPKGPTTGWPGWRR